MRRHILVIAKNEQLGRWFRYRLAGCHIGLPTTVVADLAAALPVVKRLRPRVVILVADNGANPNDQLVLLRVLLRLGEQRDENTLGLLYDPVHNRLLMCHTVHLSGVRPEDVVSAATETASCPLFACEESDKSRYPDGCRYVPLMIKSVALADEAAPTPERKAP